MNVVVSIQHPAWAHQFRYIIKELQAKGHQVTVLAVDKDKDLELLDAFGIPYVKMANSTGKNLWEKGWLFFKLCITFTHQCRKAKADVLIGRASPMMAVAAFLLGKPHVIFEDTEVSTISLAACKLFSRCIMTPEKFQTDLGKKHVRLPLYKELFYLHRKEFTPDRSILERHGIDPDAPFAVVRLISWNAIHDVGMHGLTDQQKIDFIRSLAEMLPVYLSSEANTPEELKPYLIRLPYEDIHHLLYYATVVLSEGASTASEAAILGTHAFYLNEIASGTTEEQEQRFHLLRVLHDPKTRYETALRETRELLKTPDLWKKGKEKREALLSEMPDPNDVFLEKMEEVLQDRKRA